MKLLSEGWGNSHFLMKNGGEGFQSMNLWTWRGRLGVGKGEMVGASRVMVKRLSFLEELCNFIVFV